MSLGVSQRGVRAVAALVAAATIALGAVAPAAHADPIADKQAQAAALRARIDAQAEQAEALAEQLNGARYRLQQADAALADSQRRVAAAEAEQQRVRALVARRAAQLYKETGSPQLLQALDANNVVKSARIATYAGVAAHQDRELLRRLAASRATLARERDAQDTARKQAASEAASVATARDQAAAADRSLRAQLASVDAETQRLIAQQREAQARAEAAAAAARAAALRNSTTTTRPTTTTKPGTPTTRPVTTTTVRGSSTTRPPTTTTQPPSYPPPPPVSSGAAAAIAFARAQLGKPYLFAAAGPDAYDCSGLTMAAWRAGGVRLPHYSAAQATMFAKVAYEDLQPGDLVFFYTDLHHVGLYIGGGMMIHAPQTGDVVKIAPAWRTTFQWGVRPG